MRILVLCPIMNDIFNPIAKACYESFQTLGHDVDYATEYKEGYDLALFTAFHHPWKIPKQTSTVKLGYHFELLPWRYTNSHLQRSLKKFKHQVALYDYVVDFSYNNAKWLQQQGYKNVFWCALGYHPSLENESKYNLHTECPVRFIGSSQKRRLKILKYINNKLSSKQIPIETRYVGPNDNCGANVHLNIHSYEVNSFESHRLIVLMSNQQFVITEPVDDCHPFNNKRHWIETKWRHLPLEIEYYVHHPKERSEIANQAYHFIREQYNFVTHLQRLLHEIRSKDK